MDQGDEKEQEEVRGLRGHDLRLSKEIQRIKMVEGGARASGIKGADVMLLTSLRDTRRGLPARSSPGAAA